MEQNMPVNSVQVTTPVDTQNLATVVTEWRRIHEEIAQHKQQASEKNKRAKVLESIIMNIMKQQNLGALDLKNSGGRILYEKQQRKSGLNTKNIQKLLTEHLKDEVKAAEAVKYMTEHREAVTKEKLAYEKL
jgi:histone H3/H4